MTDHVMSISDVGVATGVAPDALRYYEREHIIGPIARDSGGRRRFSENDVAWIGVVTCMRKAGLGIADLREFAQMMRTDTEAADRVAFLRERREVLTERMSAMARALSVLDDKIAYYSE